MEKLFFDFLQVAVGNRKSLSIGISDADWHRLFEFCKKQALIGVGFTAVEKLHVLGVECPANLRMKWMTLALHIEKRNVLLNEQCKKLAKRYEHDGFLNCVLKGQGNLMNYPEGLNTRRLSGDIDIWCIPPQDGLDIALEVRNNVVEFEKYLGKGAVMEYVRLLHRLKETKIKPVVRYHHIEAPKIDGTEVEVHFRVGFVNSPLRNRRMQRWFDAHADVCMKNKTHMGFAVPTASVNVVYQMCHLFSHYFDEGIGLRQLMDYYFVLRAWHNDVMECKDLQSQGMWSEGLGTPVMSAKEVMAVLRSFGMGKFAGAVMWVLNEVFENEECRMKNEECTETDDVVERELSQINRELKENNFEPWMICDPNEKEGKKLLEEIMKGGNFGQYDTRDAELKKGGMMKHGVWKLKRVMKLVRSYPEEALWEPVFRVWHLGWRLIH